MKPQQMAVAESVGTPTEDGAVATAPVATAPERAPTAFNRIKRSPPAVAKLSLVPEPESARLHTLILTGELDRGSAQTLEAEIDRLCEEGVAGITLDLRELTYIDSVGVAVIASRCGLCRRRGYEFALIPGSRSIHRVFEQTGVAGLLPFRDGPLRAEVLTGQSATTIEAAS